MSQAVLNIDEKTRSNMFPWRGQFSPQLVEAHLAAYAKSFATVLDPFVGSGTVLIEGIRHNHSVFGAEINPAAAMMARTYKFAMLPLSVRLSAVSVVDHVIRAVSAYNDIPLFRGNGGQSSAAAVLCEAHSALANDLPRHLLESLIVVLDFHGGDITARRLSVCWKNIRGMVLGLPYTENQVSVALADARRLPLDNHLVDLVLTSPPYINVFNYHQQYRASVEALNWDVLPLARSEIGSNRKYRGNRFLTVVQYCLDMAQVFCELSRVCRPGARAIFVVGRQSNVRKTVFYNGQILQALAQHVLGLHVVLQQERVFQNRFGQAIYEDILHFRMRPVACSDWLERARHFAANELWAAKTRVPDDVRSDFHDALDRAAEVEPSPIVDTATQPRHLIDGFSR